ncbi:unnamed protein product [Callosobruchus maculatus]|uniref:Uncharacterized protein n=1 Tax=Callosobruchus maculatus TaxID=64391 RepID=A0A653CZR5_CALMS|nr:unnamed protein product [Callosobruchus maculatus]
MPKRPRSSKNSSDSVTDSVRKKSRRYEKLQEKLEKLRNELLTRSNSSDSEQAQSDPEEDNVEDNLVPSNSSCIMNPFETDENVASVVEAPVTDTVLDLFGEDPLNDKNNGADMLPELAKRFNHSLANGFGKEVISKLIAKHLPAANCSGLIPPILNPEIAEAFKNKDKVREDKFLISMQETVAASIMALYKETKLALDANKDVEFLADSTKLMLETFHKISLHRRYLLSPLLNVKYKKLLESQPIDKFLYGEDLLEKLKQTQASKSAASQVTSIMKPKMAKYNSTTQRYTGGNSNCMPQPVSSSRNNTRHLNYNVPSNKPKMKGNRRSNITQENRARNPSNYQPSQWRRYRRPQ